MPFRRKPSYQSRGNLRADNRIDLAIMGVLLTMYDGRNNAAKTIRNVAIGTFGEEMVFRTTIPRNTTLNKAVMSTLRSVTMMTVVLPAAAIVSWHRKWKPALIPRTHDYSKMDIE